MVTYMHIGIIIICVYAYINIYVYISVIPQGGNAISKNGYQNKKYSSQNYFIGARRTELISIETFNSKCNGVKVVCNTLE